MRVELTENEVALARFVAEQRNRDGEKAKADPAKHGFSGDNLELHVQGCLGEMAFAKARNLYWSGAGTHYYDDDDVSHVQIRVTHHENGCLLIRPGDQGEDDPWVLVIGSGREYRLAGWLWGREAKNEKYLRAPAGRPPAYFVPQSALRPVVGK